MLYISSAFDGGNIEVVSADDPADLQVRIRKDSAADFLQWFHFRLHGGRGTPCVIRFLNAGKASYARGWEGYRVVASEDSESWFRIDTDYDGTVMTARVTPRVDSLDLSYFAPYPLGRHQWLVATAQRSPRVRLEVPGRSVQGRDIDLIRVGEPADGKRSLWLIARQHPGETMAEWFVEGFLDRLLDPHDGASRALLDRAVVYVVPNMNPDGSFLGNLRTNALGANLNREWAEPSEARSPEVFHVVRRMAETGVDLCLDAHGDEALPYNFIAGFEGVPAADPAKVATLDKFRATLAGLNPDFQTAHGYPKASPGQGNLTTATGHLAHKLGAVSMTLEMPFKDAANAPDPQHGWSPARTRALARSALDAMLAVVGDLGTAKG